MIWVSGTWFQEEDETENESKTKSRNRLGNGSIPSPSPVALSLQELDPSHFFAISVFSHKTRQDKTKTLFKHDNC